MPPYMHWPSDEAKIAYRRSAFKNRVSEADIECLLSLHPSEADRYKGRPALDNLVEALELHFEPPCPNLLPEAHQLRVKIGAV